MNAKTIQANSLKGNPKSKNNNLRKNTILLFVVLAIVVSSCESKKSATEVSNAPASLEGTWALNYITGTRLSVDELYTMKKPMLTFNIKESKVNGNTGCNIFNGMISNITPGKITFDENMAMTRMYCDGDGEKVFIENFQKINGFSITDNGKTLHLMMGDIDLIRLQKKVIDN